MDWRGGAQPKEPSRLRPAVVVEDDELFPDDYPNTLVVPLTRDEGLAHGTFALRLDPTTDNGVERTSWALGHHVSSVSLRRVRVTGSQITTEQLTGLRERIVLAVGG